MDDLIVQVASHVTIIFGFEKSGVAAQLAMSYVGLLDNAMLLKSMLFKIVHIFERTQTLLTHI